MKNIIETIKKNKLIKPGEVIGVGVSGGIDSMCMLHFLDEIKEDFDFEVVAITIDHSLREEGAYDAAFVQSWCRSHKIRCYKFKIDAGAIAKENGMSIEAGAREGRYKTFESLIQKQIVDKIAIAHHMGDQAETILMHLLRGSGVAGIRGMEYMRDGIYIRPMLNTEKKAIAEYASSHNIPFVDDETNFDTKYQRNFLRQKIMPLLRSQWPGLDKILCRYASLAKEDDNFISAFLEKANFLTSENKVEIPLSNFKVAPSLVSRYIFKALSQLGSFSDIERKHIDMITALAENENGTKIDLPHNLKAIKEYGNVVIIKAIRKKPAEKKNFSFKVGVVNIPSICKIETTLLEGNSFAEDALYIDADKLPKNAKWRTREEGDVIHKLNNGEVKLKKYLIDKKVPARIRKDLPILAVGNEVLVILGVAISDKVKIDENTKAVYRIIQK